MEFKCECGKAYQQRPSLSRHQKQCIKKVTYNCIECGRQFLRQKSLNYHIENSVCLKQLEKETGYACTAAGCNSLFKHKWMLKRHQKTVHQPSEKYAGIKQGRKRRLADREVFTTDTTCDWWSPVSHINSTLPGKFSNLLDRKCTHLVS